MGFSRGPKIVTDGLVLALDAANPKSYPGSGTTWKDLSGNITTTTTTNLTREYSAFSSEFQAPGEGEKSQDGTFSCDITFPSSTPSDGLIFETGAGGNGHWIGFKGGVLKARAGDGGSDTEVSTSNTVVATTTNYPTDGQVHTLSWDWQINPGRIRIFIDGVLVAEGTNSSIPEIAGGARANYLSNASSVTSGDPTTAYIPNSASSLRYYNNQQYTTQLESIIEQKIEGQLVNGPTFDSGNLGSLVFDGTNDHIRILSNNWAQSGEDVTVLLFVKREGSAESSSQYSSLFNYSGGASGLAIFSFYVQNNYLGGWVYGTNSNYRYNSNYTIDLNEWYQVGFRVKNGSSFTVSTFVNGKNISNHSSTGVRFVNSSNTNVNTIGSFVNRNQYEWNGKIGIVRIYNRALTSSEVLQNYNATKSRFGL